MMGPKLKFNNSHLATETTIIMNDQMKAINKCTKILAHFFLQLFSKQNKKDHKAFITLQNNTSELKKKILQRKKYIKSQEPKIEML